jgi:spore germination cell wall hydrolase CwlJ-like protein
MKIFIFSVTAFIALAGVALAQQPLAPPQTVEQVSEQANGIITALQAQRNQAADQAVTAQAAASKANNEIEKLRKELAEAKVDAIKARAEKHEAPEPEPAK